MYLHDDKDVFIKIISIVSDYYKIDESIVEKDYYVTLFLKELVKFVPNIIFKGGTSLSKCHKVIERFSEDLDLTLSEDDTTTSNKKLIKKTIIKISEQLNLTIDNLEQIRSRRDFNAYSISYDPIHKTNVIKDRILVETTFITYGYPVHSLSANSIIYDYFKEVNKLQLIENYDLSPFNLFVQSLERTFIDKVFAICDYYLNNTIHNHSRHIYDLFKIFSIIEFDEKFKKLVKKVREDRSKKEFCLSAKNDVNINELLTKIIDKNIFELDYNDITKSILYNYVSYNEAITVLHFIIASNTFI